MIASPVATAAPVPFNVSLVIGTTSPISLIIRDTDDLVGRLTPFIQGVVEAVGKQDPTAYFSVIDRGDDIAGLTARPDRDDVARPYLRSYVRWPIVWGQNCRGFDQAFGAYKRLLRRGSEFRSEARSAGYRTPFGFDWALTSLSSTKMFLDRKDRRHEFTLDGARLLTTELGFHDYVVASLAIENHPELGIPHAAELVSAFFCNQLRPLFG